MINTSYPFFAFMSSSKSPHKCTWLTLTSSKVVLLWRRSSEAREALRDWSLAQIRHNRMEESSNPHASVTWLFENEAALILKENLTISFFSALEPLRNHIVYVAEYRGVGLNKLVQTLGVRLIRYTVRREGRLLAHHERLWCSFEVWQESQNLKGI